MFIHDISHVIAESGMRRLSSIQSWENGYPAVSLKTPEGDFSATKIVEERASSSFEEVFLNVFQINGDQTWLLRMRTTKPLDADHGFCLNKKGGFRRVSLQRISCEVVPDFDGYMTRLEGDVLVGSGLHPVFVRIPFGQQETPNE